MATARIKIGLQVRNLTAVQKALEGKANQYADGAHRGLKKAGLFLQGESQRQTPVDTGALRNSAGTRASGKGFGTVVRVGYSVRYAVYVHENLFAHHPVGNAKFLERPARQHRKTLGKIVAAEMT